jgi:hypothetical protein
MGGKVTPPPAYGTVKAKECDTVGSNETLMLDCARREVSQTMNNYAQSRTNIEHYKNGTNLALFGTATAAGVNAVTKGSKEGLQTLALSAVGLLQLDSTLDADKQHKAYGAGLDALQCLVDLDLSLGELADHVARSKSQGAQNERNAVDQVIDQLSDVQQASLKIELRGATTQGGIMMYETNERRTAVLNTMRVRADAASELRRVLESRTKTARAQELILALNDVKVAVSDHLLYKHEHLAGIYSSITTALNSAAPAVQAAQTGEAAGRRIERDQNRTLSVLTAQFREQARGVEAKKRELEQKITEFRTAEARDDALLNSARKLSQTYNECVLRAQQKEKTTPPPAP